MRKILALYAAMVFGLTAAIWAEAGVTTTTTTETRSYSGTVTDFNPGRSVIVLRSESVAEPLTYRVTDRTIYVDEAGNPVSLEEIHDRPVTVFYGDEGGSTVVEKIVVQPRNRVIQRKETTTIEHR